MLNYFFSAKIKFECVSSQIYLDGTNIKELNLKWFREQVGLVSQEPVLFATTVEVNTMTTHTGDTLLNKS